MVLGGEQLEKMEMAAMVMVMVVVVSDSKSL
jgi:hypothetical protein